MIFLSKRLLCCNGSACAAEVPVTKLPVRGEPFSFSLPNAVALRNEAVVLAKALPASIVRYVLFLEVKPADRFECVDSTEQDYDVGSKVSRIGSKSRKTNSACRDAVELGKVDNMGKHEILAGAIMHGWDVRMVSASKVTPIQRRLHAVPIPATVYMVPIRQ